MAQGIKTVITTWFLKPHYTLVSTVRILLQIINKNVANIHIHSPQLWRTKNYCWTSLNYMFMYWYEVKFKFTQIKSRKAIFQTLRSSCFCFGDNRYSGLGRLGSGTESVYPRRLQQRKASRGSDKTDRARFNLLND